MSKKKAPAKAERSKGIDLLSEAAILKEAQMKKAIKEATLLTHMKELVDDDDDDQEGDDERIESNDDKSTDLNKTDDEEKTQKDKFVHTSEDYVPTDDETNDVDDEEYDHINKEMYDDVNVQLKDAEPADEGKGDKEMTEAEKVEAQATTTVDPAQVASSSRSVSSNYGSIFLILDNISSVETEFISMLDVQVQHENPRIHSSSLLTVPISVIPEPTILSSILETVTTALVITIPPSIPSFIPHSLHSTTIPTLTTTEGTTSTPVVQKSKTLSPIHLRVLDLEKEVKELQNVDHYLVLLATIKSEVPVAVKEYLGTSLDDALHKMCSNSNRNLRKSGEDIHKIKIEHAAKQQESQYTITSSDKVALKEFD
ncbi:hypothetical protein Tco_0313041 [Tanacetum coccineum]